MIGGGAGVLSAAGRFCAPSQLGVTAAAEAVSRDPTGSRRHSVEWVNWLMRCQCDADVGDGGAFAYDSRVR